MIGLVKHYTFDLAYKLKMFFKLTKKYITYVVFKFLRQQVKKRY